MTKTHEKCGINLRMKNNAQFVCNSTCAAVYIFR